MAAAHSLIEARTFEQKAQVIEPDGGIGGSAEDPPEDFVRSHKDILPAPSDERLPFAPPESLPPGCTPGSPVRGNDPAPLPSFSTGEPDALRLTSANADLGAGFRVADHPPGADTSQIAVLGTVSPVIGQFHESANQP